MGTNIKALAEEQKKKALPNWQDPIPFEDYKIPKIDIDIFPPWLRDFVEDVAESTQTPEDAASMAALSILSTVSSKKFYVNITPEWNESLNTYIVLALPPGNRKSSVFKLIQAPIISYEREEQKRMGKAVKHQRALIKAKNKRIEELEKRYAKKEEVNEAILEEINQLTNEIDNEELLHVPRYITGDITAEKLGVLLAENNEKIAVLSAEGGGVFNNMAGRYSNDGKANIDIYLNGHTGDYTPVDRIGRDPIILQEPCITIGLFVQPQVVRDVPSTFKERGLMQRFLYSFPKSLVGYRKIDANPIRESVKSEYEINIRRLLEYKTTDQIKLTFDEEAKVVQQEISQEIEIKLREGEVLADLKEWGSKLAGQLIRIAGLLHLAEQVTGNLKEIPKEINASTLKKAKQLMNYFISHARVAYGVMGSNSDLEDAKYLINYLIKNGKDSYTRREVFQGTKGTFKNVARFESAVEELEVRNFIRKETTNQIGKGRKSYKLLLNSLVTIPSKPTKLDYLKD
jgi:replicative DNA helicase